MAPRKVSKGKKPAETMRQRQMRLRKEQQARKSRLAKRPSSAATNQRIDKVKVKVEPQKNLPAGKTQKALPPGKKGGAVSTNNRPRRRNVNTNPSSKTTRTGSQSPASVRNEQAAVRRAKAEIGRNRMGPISAVVAAVTEAVLKPVARGAGYQGGRAIRKALGGGEPTLDSKGNPIKKKSTSKSTSASRKKKEDQYNRAVTAAKSTVKTTKAKTTPKPTPTKTPANTSPKRKATTTPKKKTGANDPRNAAYIAARKKLNSNSSKAERDKVRDMGLKISKGIQGDKGGRKTTPPKAKPATTAAAQNLRSGRKPPEKKKRQSAANKAGYPGNRNY